MASTTALYTGLSGLNAHSRKLDVVGNNISNVNTTAFKGSRLEFEAQITRSLSVGSAPSASFGGRNPSQIGLGVGIAGTQRDVSVGSLTVTGDQRDLAIEGAGHFIVEADGRQFYTRNGSFRPDADDNLVTLGGERLLGRSVDEDFQVVETGELEPISVPLGRLTIAEATENVVVAGNINAGGDPATTGGVTRLRGEGGTGLTLLAPNEATAITGASLLVDIRDPLSTANPLFAAGQSLRFEGIQKGGLTVPAFTVPITATTTLDDLTAAVNLNLGIDTSVTNPDGATPGLTLTGLAAGPGGEAQVGLDIISNIGSLSDFDLGAANVDLLDAGGALVRQPFSVDDIDNQVEADGESTRTTAIVFDSLGNTVEVDVTLTLVSKNPSNGTTWRYEIASDDDQTPGGGPFLQSGTVSFDSQGELIGPEVITVSVNRSASGADSPLAFSLGFAGDAGRLTSLVDVPSQFEVVSADGLPASTLESFSVSGDGTVIGAFGNSATRVLGQVVLATFVNEAGLVDLGGGLFQTGPNSGPPVVVGGGEFGTGQIVGGALEESNVDLGEEFINLILTTTGYSAASRVISTTDELLQQLLVLGR